MSATPLMETVGIYIQIPFCASKCTFCNFSSRVVRAALYDEYTLALIREIERLPSTYEAAGISPPVLALPVDTIYIGGGTPSLIGADRLEQVFGVLHSHLRICGELEVTLEVTPGSADSQLLRKVRGLGVNRLSIGAQTFNDRELRSVGRLHSAAATRELVARARSLGFTNVGVDLVAGLPYQTEPSWLDTLSGALALRPQHISVYLFEIDEKSRLGREILRAGQRYHAPAVPGDDFMAEAYDRARELLVKEGYDHYEISNFALPGYASRHNRKYWQLEPYVGLGAGAHSFDGKHRWANVPEADPYIARLARRESPLAEVRSLSREDQISEFFYLGLRQSDGINLGGAGRRWGIAELSRWEPRITALVEQGWLERRAEQLRLTDRAYLLSNEIFQEFLGAWQERIASAGTSPRETPG